MHVFLYIFTNFYNFVLYLVLQNNYIFSYLKHILLQKIFVILTKFYLLSWIQNSIFKYIVSYSRLHTLEIVDFKSISYYVFWNY